MEIDEILDDIYLLPENSKLALKKIVSEINHKKGHTLIKANKIEKYIYFIKKGIVRAYVNYDGIEITFWFGKEGQTVVSMKSYVESKASYENISLLEDCEMYQLKADELKILYKKDVHIANWGRKFAEKELIKTEERLINREFKTAKEKYSDLLKYNSDLIKRVKLGYLASYLGITQVSLSRIRAKIN
ncbi:Crp/Fnr family transcriptional regulator [Lacinutrix mariniflava]|uniref:Crp/Fnr family transcriptional regulator n=1 Tax=Lacinutrix mariniflava TaxID=342955 RepID=UPI0006E35538|nr:Crp/Fnr family transcriptional regulator [Lacinutrix mariniflava]